MRLITFGLCLLGLLLSNTFAAAQFSGTTYYYYTDPGNNGIPIAGSTGVPVDAGSTYVQVLKTGSCVPVPQYGPPGCYVGLINVPLSSFGDGAKLAAIQNQMTDVNNRLVATSAKINDIQAGVSRSLEIGAIAASMRDAIPNPGDRFAVRLNAAGFDGYAGGSIGVSVNLSDAVRFSANYGRGLTQNVVSGGINVSFR